MTRSVDLVVIGGGITGAFVSYFASEAGMKTVLIDDSIACHASAKNPGGLNPLHGPGIPGKMGNFALQSYKLHLDNWQKIAHLSKIDFSRKIVSRIQLAFNNEDLPSLKKGYDLYNKTENFSATWLSKKDLLQLEPRLNPQVIEGLLMEGNATVSPQKYTQSIIGAAESLGTLVISSKAQDIEFESSTASHVICHDHRISCGHVVIATGPWVTLPQQWLGCEIPVRPIKGELLFVKSPHHFNHDFTWRTAAVYQCEQGTCLGGTWTKEGFADIPTDLGKKSILEKTSQIFPDVSQWEIVKHTAGLRPVSVDGFPILKKINNCKNVYLATGAGRKGMLLSSGMAKAIIEIIQSGTSKIIERL